jgi:hypothetical protein
MKEALKPVSLLVERFRQNIEADRNPAYSETQIRIEFIAPFFKSIMVGRDFIVKYNWKSCRNEGLFNLLQREVIGFTKNREG